MNLTNRIAEALTVDRKSDEVEPLIAEIAAAIASATTDVARHRAIALDPTSSSAAVKGARSSMDDAQFTVDRLTEAEKRISDRVNDLRRDEAAAKRKAEEEALSARQKAARDRFNAEYPQMARRIAELATEMIAAGIEAELPNIKLGDGPVSRIGTGFNQRRFWPLPKHPYEQPGFEPANQHEEANVTALADPRRVERAAGTFDAWKTV